MSLAHATTAGGRRSRRSRLGSVGGGCRVGRRQAFYGDVVFIHTERTVVIRVGGVKLQTFDAGGFVSADQTITVGVDFLESQLDLAVVAHIHRHAATAGEAAE